MDCWLHCTSPAPDALVRLLCLPTGGGTAQDFAAWPARLSPRIHVCPVQLPGRQERFAEPALDHAAPLARELAQVARRLTDLPLVFFGDCMGAILAFEVARELRRAGSAEPRGLIVASYPAPDHPRAAPALRDAPKERLRDYLQEIGGLPPLAAENEELFELLLPTLRADFAVVETYTYSPEPPLPCDIHVIGGREDPYYSAALLAGWKRHTSRSFSQRMFAGDHLVVRQNAEVLAHVQRLTLGLVC